MVIPSTERDALIALCPRLGRRASVAPGRTRAPTPLALVESVADGCRDEARVRALSRGLCTVVRAVLDNFPDNIFWDLEYVAGCLFRADDIDATRALARRIGSVCAGFGVRSSLRFRYAHDFLYGYDWARWVSRAPETRRAIGPYDAEFFTHLEGRRRTMLELVEKNDSEYGRLESGEFRNPFTFTREPPEEAKLHTLLARANLIPVKAWRIDGDRVWDMPFTDLRATFATHLGIASRATQ